jgi:hypothetical protein
MCNIFASGSCETRILIAIRFDLNFCLGAFIIPFSNVPCMIEMIRLNGPK